MIRSRTPPVHQPEPASLHVHAMNDLRFIREVMERSASFTAVSGWGTILMGCTALIAAVAASRSQDIQGWLILWLFEGVLAVLIGVVAMIYKARLVKTSLLSAAGWRFLLNLSVPILGGVPLSIVFYQHELASILPGLWLLLYGVGVVTGGAFSVRTIPIMGSCFIFLGILAFLVAPAAGNLFMGLGFGGLHILFGGIIAWRHGG